MPMSSTSTPTSATIPSPDVPISRPLPIRVLTSPWARLALLGAMIVAAAAIALTNDGLSLEGIRGTIDDLGMVAPLVYVLLYAVATVLLLPGTPFTVAAGLLFGPVGGSITALVGATLGATLSFLVGRAVGRRAVEQLAGRRVQAIDDLLSRRGFAAILMIRLIPLFPFNVVNLVSGITALRPRDYVFGTAIGIIPGTVLLAALGGSIDDPTSPVFLGALAGFLALTAVSGVVARRMRARDRVASGHHGAATPGTTSDAGTTGVDDA
jgi:uncharacterized membrane protein YdjX (TVP38/TMEM64 family)